MPSVNAYRAASLQITLEGALESPSLSPPLAGPARPGDVGQATCHPAALLASAGSCFNRTVVRVPGIFSEGVRASWQGVSGRWAELQELRRQYTFPRGLHVPEQVWLSLCGASLLAVGRGLDHGHILR